MSIAEQISAPTVPAYDSELMRLDRLVRFLVVADELPESGFRHFGLTGHMTRIALQLGWSTEEAHAYIWDRYQSYLALFKTRPTMFLETTERLRSEYGEDLLRRWGALLSTE